MPELDRIVAWERRLDAACSARPHERLGQTERLTWAAVADDAVLPRERATTPALIFYTRADYEQAMRDLTPEQVAEAVERRVQSFVPVDQSSERLYRDERRCLALAARAHAGAAPPAQAALAAHFDRGVAWLTTLTSERRYDGLPPDEVLVLCVEAEAALIVEHKDARAVAEQVGAEHAVQMAHAQATELHEQRATTQAGWLARLGRPQFSVALPFVDVARAAWVFPVVPAMIDRLHAEHQPHVEWRGGVVMSATGRQRKAFRERGKKVEVVFLSGGELTAALEELTPAQLERELAAGQAAYAAAPLEAHVAHVQGRELEALLLESATLELLSSKAPGAAPDLGTQVAQAAAALREWLARSSTWAPAGGAGAPLDRAGGGLLEAEQAALRDLRLAIELARRDERNDLAAALDRLRQAKEHDLAALRPHLGG